MNSAKRRQNKIKNTDPSRPYLSFIVPAYNAEATIRRCIDSVLRQDFDSYEILVVDDGSTDNTKSIIESIADERLVYTRKQNGGVSSARNLGLKKAIGEWIVFLDSDDILLPKSMSAIVKALKESDADFVITPARTTGDKRKASGQLIPLNKKAVIDDIIFKPPRRQNANFAVNRQPGGKLIRKQLVDKHGIRFVEGLQIFEDGVFNIQTSIAAVHIFFFDKQFYSYTDNKNSRTNTFYPEVIRDNKVILKTIETILAKNHIDSKTLPCLKVELFNTSLLEIALEKNSRRKKVEKIKEVEKIFLQSARHSIQLKELPIMLRYEYRLCSLHMYTTLLCLCKIKSSIKKLRGRL